MADTKVRVTVTTLDGEVLEQVVVTEDPKIAPLMVAKAVIEVIEHKFETEEV